jgi:hypothetical protein
VNYFAKYFKPFRIFVLEILISAHVMREDVGRQLLEL